MEPRCGEPPSAEPRRAVIDLLQKHGQTELAVGIRFDMIKKATEFLQGYKFNIDKNIRKTKGREKVGNYVCVDISCDWNVRVSRRPGSTRQYEFRVSSVSGQHSGLCSSFAKPSQRQLQSLPALVAAVVAGKQVSFSSLALLLQQKDHLNVQKQRSTVYRARDATTEDLAPSWSESFSYIAPLLKNFQRLNPGSQVSVDKEPRFMRAFVGIGTAIRTTQSSIRLTGFDGTHSKNPEYCGTVLTLIGADGNGTTITIAFAVVHRGNKANIRWFFQQCVKSNIGFGAVPVFCDRGHINAAAKELWNSASD